MKMPVEVFQDMGGGCFDVQRAEAGTGQGAGLDEQRFEQAVPCVGQEGRLLQQLQQGEDEMREE